MKFMRESLGEKTSFETAQLFLVSRLAGRPFASRIESRMGRVFAHEMELFSSFFFSSHLSGPQSIDTPPKNRFYSVDEACRCTTWFDLLRFSGFQCERRRRTQDRRKSNAAPDRVEQRFRISKNETF